MWNTIERIIYNIVEKKKRIFNTEEKKIVSIELKKQLEKVINVINNKIEQYNEKKDLSNMFKYKKRWKK